MKLILIRHAIAEDRVDFSKAGLPDSERPLTRKGIQKFAQVSLGYSDLIPEVDVLYSSPYKRALQTSEILQSRYKGLPISFTESLVPHAEPEDFLSVLKKHESTDIVVAIGHEPHLSEFACRILASNSKSFLYFKKGGALCVDFPGTPEFGEGSLRWYLGPRQVLELL